MFNKSVDDVLKSANKVIEDLEQAATRAYDKAAKKSEEIVNLQNEVKTLDREAHKGMTVAERFKALINVED